MSWTRYCKACGFLDWRFDGLSFVDVFGADFHQAAAVVSHQNIVLALLLVDNHVERTVVVAQFGDGRSFDLFPGHQLGNRDLDKRSAGVSGQDVRFAVDRIRRKRAYGGLRFQFAVRTVVNFNIGPRCNLRERKRDSPESR